MADRYRIAAASNDGRNVDEHFGRASFFHIYDVVWNESCERVDIRSLDPACMDGTHDAGRLIQNANLLEDCDYVIASRIGPGAMRALEEKGIEGYELPGDIEEAIDRLSRYKQVQDLFN